MAPKHFNICKLYHCKNGWANNNSSTFNVQRIFSVPVCSKDSFHTRNSWGRCHLHDNENSLIKNWHWQGWGSQNDMKRFILKGPQDQLHSQVKIIFQFFIFIGLVSVYFKFHNHFNYSQLWQKFRKEKNLLFQVNFSPLYV